MRLPPLSPQTCCQAEMKQWSENHPIAAAEAADFRAGDSRHKCLFFYLARRYLSVHTAHSYLSGAWRSPAQSGFTHTTTPDFLKARDSSPSSHGLIPQVFPNYKLLGKTAKDASLHSPLQPSCKSQILAPHARGGDLRFIALCVTGAGAAVGMPS